MIDGPTITIPAVLGAESVVALVGKFLRVALNAGSPHTKKNISRERLKWPEYVLWPDHLLTFFDEGISEPVLHL
jgi:hypothetical protein